VKDCTQDEYEADIVIYMKLPVIAATEIAQLARIVVGVSDVPIVADAHWLRRAVQHRSHWTRGVSHRRVERVSAKVKARRNQKQGLT